VGPNYRAWSIAVGLGVVGCTTTGDVLDAIDTGDTGDTGDTSPETGASGELTGVDGSSSDGSGLDACGGSAGAWWCPEPGLTWQVQRIGPIDATVDAAVYGVPMFATDVATIAALHGEDRRVVCWFSAGISTWSDPDRNTVLPATGPDIVPGQPERWIDLGSSIVRDAMLVRLDQAVALGCDAVEPGDIDGYLADSGLPLTREGTVEFVAWLADGAHARGLAIALHDGNELAADLEPAVDLAMDYGCMAAGTCAQLGVFGSAGKLVLHAEIVPAEMVAEIEPLAAELCPQSDMLALVTIFKKPDLNAWRHPCD
jgi:Glycoside-hydrolase family GH114